MAYKGWLTPSLLLCIWENGSFRGHELAEGLAGMGFGEIDQRKLHRALRKLQNDGLVASGDAFVDQAAWRRYEITASGERHLELWAKAFAEYRPEMEHFLRLYGRRPARHESRV